MTDRERADEAVVDAIEREAHPVIWVVSGVEPVPHVWARMPRQLRDGERADKYISWDEHQRQIREVVREAQGEINQAYVDGLEGSF